MSDIVDRETTGWRQTAAREAYEATVREARDRWQIEDHPANYRWTHIQAVVRLALQLAELTGADREVVEAAAWLHDCAKRGKDDNHGHEGSIRAGQILRATDFPEDKVDDVVDAISKHVGLWVEEPVEPLEAAVLWDADKLSKLGAAAAMQDTGIWVMVRRGSLDALPDAMAAQDWRERTVASFHTRPARTAGRRRLAAQQAFWQQVGVELDGDDLAASMISEEDFQ